LEKEGRRGSDEAFYKLILVAGDAVLKLAGVARGFPYELQAETLKDKKVSPDIVGVPLSQDGDVVLVEFQGYPDPFIRHRLAGRMVQYCYQKRYTGGLLPVIFHTEEAYFKAALPLRLEDTSAAFRLEGQFREIILEGIPEEDLLAADPRLVVLAPLCTSRKISGEELANKARQWAVRVRELYPEDRATEAMDVMALFLLNRFRNLSRQEVIAMLNFDLAETKAGQDIFRMGEEEGVQKGLLRKSREDVIEILEVRFEVAPRSITEIINGMDDLSILKMLLKKAATIESLDEFRRVLEKALS
jgi:hypothetical protein